MRLPSLGVEGIGTVEQRRGHHVIHRENLVEVFQNDCIRLIKFPYFLTIMSSFLIVSKDMVLSFIDFNNKMSDCTKCRMMIEILKREAEELIEREQKLVRVNDALMEAMGQQQSLESEENDWKSKY